MDDCGWLAICHLTIVKSSWPCCANVSARQKFPLEFFDVGNFPLPPESWHRIYVLLYVLMDFSISSLGHSQVRSRCHRWGISLLWVTNFGTRQWIPFEIVKACQSYWNLKLDSLVLKVMHSETLGAPGAPFVSWIEFQPWAAELAAQSRPPIRPQSCEWKQQMMPAYKLDQGC